MLRGSREAHRARRVGERAARAVQARRLLGREQRAQRRRRRAAAAAAAERARRRPPRAAAAAARGRARGARRAHVGVEVVRGRGHRPPIERWSALNAARESSASS